jgi:hypothetical protein
MKRSRIVIAIGTFALAIAAVFATKANKKFVSISSAKGLYGTSQDFFIYGSSAFLTTSSTNPGVFLKIYTSHSGTNLSCKTLYTIPSDNVQAFFK